MITNKYEKYSQNKLFCLIGTLISQCRSTLATNTQYPKIHDIISWFKINPKSQLLIAY